MGHRVSTMAEARSAGSAGSAARAHPVQCGSRLVGRAFLLAALVSVAASSSPASRAAAGAPAGSPAATAAATCCFVTAAERPIANGQKFRRRPRDGAEVAHVPPSPAPSSAGGGCPYTGQLVPPTSSRLRFRSGRDVGTELTVPPSVASKRKGKNKTGEKGSWFKVTKRKSALVTVDEEEYERRKLEWADKYTNLSTLRQSFGTNRNKLWGDFDPETTRKLYHTLLPRALMALNDLGVMTEQELAPLAYEARCAAKKYARERCVVPGRIFSMAYDGYRSWRDHGKWNAEGMTWDQVWDKYEQQITEEFKDVEADADELTRQICLRILERSCMTNPKVDKIFLGDKDGKKKITKKSDLAKRKKQMDIAAISAKLERDVHELLFEGAQKSILFEPTKNEKREKRREGRRQRTGERRKKRQGLSDLQSQEVSKPEVSLEELNDDEENECRHLSAKDVAVLRKIVEAKKKVVAVLRSERLVQMQLRREMQKHLRQEEAENKAKTRANTSLKLEEPSTDGELKAAPAADNVVPSRELPAHRRRKVWQGRNNDVLPQRWRRRRNMVRPDAPTGDEL